MKKIAGGIALATVGAGILAYGLYASAKDAVATRYYCSRWFTMKHAKGRP